MILRCILNVRAEFGDMHRQFKFCDVVGVIWNEVEGEWQMLGLYIRGCGFGFFAVEVDGGCVWIVEGDAL